MITTKNLNDVRKQIVKLVKDEMYVVVRALDDDFNRKIFEMNDVDMIVGLESRGERDYMKQRNSGMNEVLCKLAKKNDIKIGVEVEKIFGLGKIEKARVLARVSQNIKLCKRVGCKIVLLCDQCKLSKQDIMGFFKVLGGSTKQGKIGKK
jgi:RNase P/RNase MRP subunit p30